MKSLREANEYLSFFEHNTIKLKVLTKLFTSHQDIIFNCFNIKLSLKDNLLHQSHLEMQSTPFKTGSYGNIHLLRRENSANYDYVIKINQDRLDFKNRLILKSIINEIGYYHLLSKYKLGPELHKSVPFVMNLQTGYYGIIQKKYRSDLHTFFKKYHDRVTINYIEMKTHHCIDQIYKLGLICYDLKPTNILVNYNNNGDISDLVITDFDDRWCQRINDENREFITNNTKLFQLYLILPITVMSLYLNVCIFHQEIRQLKKCIKTKQFKTFINHVIFSESFRDKIYPVLYYIIHYFHNNNIKFKKFPYTLDESITTQYSIYLIKKFVSVYQKKYN